jgi:hypothetical protein
MVQFSNLKVRYEVPTICNFNLNKKKFIAQVCTLVDTQSNTAYSHSYNK